MSGSADSPLVTVLTRYTLQCANENRYHPTSPSSPTVKLGPFDQTVAPSVPIAVVFVYRQSNPTAEPILIGRLKRALELLLDYYPHLTGRLHINPADGSYEITRLDTGAQLLIARCSERLDAFSSSQGRISVQDLPDSGNALFAPFDSTIEGVCRDPLFTLQHTRFVCGGVTLGVRLYHVVCDADGLFQLVRQLAELYRGLKVSESKLDGLPTLAHPPHTQSYMSQPGNMTPEEKQAVLEYQPSLFYLEPSMDGSAEGKAAKAIPNEPPPPVVGRILRFSGQQLEALKAHATDPNCGDSWVSTFDALSALLYQRIYQARLQRYAGAPGLLPPLDFLTSVNCRWSHRFSYLPPMYFPNAFLCLYTTVSHDVLTHAPLWQVAKHIHDLTHSGMLDAQHLEKTLRWIAAQPDKRRIRRRFRFGNGNLVVTQWSKYDMYAGSEFEEGERPVLVSLPFTSTTLMDGMIYFLPAGAQAGEDKGAIDVHVSVSEPVWEILDQDEQLSRFSSTWS